MPTLLDMPDVVMNLVLQKSEFESIQNLRKSCRDLRNFIDDAKSESEVTRIFIEQEAQSVRMNLSFHSRDRTYIEYRNDKDGCIVLWRTDGEWKQRSFANSNYLDIACRDMKLLLDTKNACVLEKIYITLQPISYSNTRILEELKKVLEARTSPIKVSRLDMYFRDLEQVLSILRFVDPKKLEFLRIGAEKGPNFDITKITELEQWKCAKTISLSDFQADDIPLENFLHCETLHVDFTEFTLDMVLQLKEAFLRSPHMQFFRFMLNKRFDSTTRLIELFGGQDNRDGSYEWDFETPEDSILKISVYGLHRITFHRISRDEVPDTTVVRNL